MVVLKNKKQKRHSEERLRTFSDTFSAVLVRNLSWFATIIPFHASTANHASVCAQVRHQEVRVI